MSRLQKWIVSSLVLQKFLILLSYKKYKTIPPDQRLFAIKKVAPKFLAEKQNGLQLLQNLYQIMKADGKINVAEKKLFEQIKDLINEVQ